MTSPELLNKYGFTPMKIELARSNKGEYVEGYTGFPKPNHSYRLTIIDNNMSVESVYYWFTGHLRRDQGYHDFTKITDTFSASEHSSFFGSAQQRLGIQQDKVSQFLATIGKMVKELFQLVRELRILDERLAYYEDSFTNSKSHESAEITLKGIWIDLVEQGSKNPASVYGMARELQFTVLPDLFFSIHPKKAEDVDIKVDKLDFNRKVKEVLKRKLRTYLEWKKSTYKELQARKKFTLKYLRQHYDVIKMYVSWVKPYLKNIHRLQMIDKHKHTDLISAFETALIEVELMAKNLPTSRDLKKEITRNKEIYGVFLLHINFRSRANMAFHQEYQKGPIHQGKVDILMMGYTWTKKEVEKYLKMKEEEEMQLLASVDGSVKAAMEALGAELEKYLDEAGEDTTEIRKQMMQGEEDNNKKKKGSSMLEPFAALLGLHKKSGKHKVKKKKEMSSVEKDREKKVANSSVKGALYQTYKNFKKNQKLPHW